MTGAEAVRILETLGDAAKAEQMAGYHKAPRRYLGVSNPELDRIVGQWRKTVGPDQWVGLASELWRTDIHEAMIAAAKLLDRRHLPSSEDAAWRLLCGWVGSFDAWAVADHAMIAGQKRLVERPERIQVVESWTTHPNMWARRAALVVTLPYAKVRAPTEDQLAVRARVLGWAARYVADQEWFIQKVVAWWLRELSKVDPAATAAFMEAHGAQMRAFARREATKYL